MQFAQKIIIEGMQFSSNKYCKIDSNNKEKVTTFDFEIKIKEKYYSYGFDILLYKNEIKAEWLYELNTNGKETMLFERIINKEENENTLQLNEKYFDEATQNRLYIYTSDMGNQNNYLLLTVMNKNKDALYQDANSKIIIFKDVYEWFTKTLTLIPPDGAMINDSYYASEDGLKKITDIVSKFGTGISNCKIEPIKKEELTSKIPLPLLQNAIKFTETNYMETKKKTENKIKATSFLRVDKELYIFEKTSNEDLSIKTVIFEHKNNEGTYSFSEESDGTRRLLDLIEIILNNETNKIYFIDELDRCLHPQLTYKFIEEFLSNRNKNNVQLIVTTHESRLLNFDLLRRDEIWFANREKNGPTELYSLEDYNERFDRRIDKAYLDGRYGGVPIFETVFPIGVE